MARASVVVGVAAALVTACSSPPPGPSAAPGSTAPAGRPPAVGSTPGSIPDEPAGAVAADAEVVVEPLLTLPIGPWGINVGRVTAGPGAVWVDLPVPVRTCTEVVRGAAVRLLAGASPAVAPTPDGGAWLLRQDGTVQRVDPDGQVRTTLAAATVHHEDDAATTNPPGGGPSLRLLAPAPDGGAWLSAPDADLVVRIRPDGTTTDERDGFEAGDAPGWTAATVDGGAWVAVPDGHAVVRLGPDGSGARHATGDAVPELVVGDGTGGAWFADLEHGTLGHLTADGAVTPVAAVDGVTDLALGPDGFPWFAADRRIGRVRDGQVERFALPIAGGLPASVEARAVSITATDEGTLVFSSYRYGGEGSTAALGRVRFGGPPAATAPGTVAPSGAVDQCTPGVAHPGDTTTTDATTTTTDVTTTLVPSREETTTTDPDADLPGH